MSGLIDKQKNNVTLIVMSRYFIIPACDIF